MDKSHVMSSDTKVVLNETVAFITFPEDPVLSLAKAHGWYLMTRCSVHVCNSRDMFLEYQPMHGHEVIMDTGDHVDVLGIGTVKLQLTTGEILTLKNVFHMPSIRKCCVSVGKLMEMGCNLSFGKEVVIRKGNKIVGKGYDEDGLFRLGTLTHVDEDSNLRTRSWYLNSRVKMHMCNSRDMYLDYQPVTGQNVVVDNDDGVNVAGIGTVMVRLTTGKVLTLVDVLHVPSMNRCAVSVSKLDDNGFSMNFGGGEVIIKMGQEILGKGYKDHGLYRLSIME